MNIEFLAAVGLNEEATADEVFYAIFPEKVDAGDRKPTTWTWMMGRIRDANVRPPRNLIDLALKSREAQLRREDRGPQEFRQESPVIGSDAVKRGLDALSDQRVEDTLLAEAGENARLIECFRNGKAEHNEETLRQPWDRTIPMLLRT